MVGGVALGLALAGCADTQAPLGPNFGNAVHHNMAVHIINPRPDYATRGAPALEGERAGLAYDRYQANEVIRPERLRTGDVGQGGSSQ
jgi:type IV pilus biogenesis protein CpaD/CtpE